MKQFFEYLAGKIDRSWNEDRVEGYKYHTWKPGIYSGFEYTYDEEHHTLRFYFPGTQAGPYSDRPWYLRIHHILWSWVWNFLFIPFVIHVGFVWSALRLRKEAATLATSYSSQEGKNSILESPPLTINIVGFSQGGAIATAVGRYIHKRLRKKDIEANVKVVNVAGPKVYGILTAWLASKIIEGDNFEVYHIRNGTDLVPMLPFAILGFVHIGKSLRIGKKKLPYSLIPSLLDHHPERYIKHLREAAADE